MLFVRIVKASGRVFKVQLSSSKIGYSEIRKTSIVALKCREYEQEICKLP